MGEAPPSRYDYEILLDHDPSGTISRHLLESFQNILHATDQLIQSSFQNLLDDTVYTSYSCCELCSRSTAISNAIPRAACESDKYFML